MKSDINSPNQMFLQDRLASLLYLYTVSLIDSNKNNLDYKSSTRYMYMIANVIDMTLYPISLEQVGQHNNTGAAVLPNHSPEIQQCVVREWTLSTKK